VRGVRWCCVGGWGGVGGGGGGGGVGGGGGGGQTDVHLSCQKTITSLVLSSDEFFNVLLLLF